MNIDAVGAQASTGVQDVDPPAAQEMQDAAGAGVANGRAETILVVAGTLLG
ncbi:MAG: hypothetical protein ABIQ70_10415 [Dokdonella sp.]